MQLNIRALHSSTGDQVLPVIMRVPAYTNRKLSWCSYPFYTEEKGYKLQLKVTNNMHVQCLSVYLCLMKAPYDDELSWPMTGRFQVKLLNQTRDESHHSRTASIYNANMIAYQSKVKATVCDNTKEVWQDLQFIKIIPRMPSQYVKNDFLIFEVSKEKHPWDDSLLKMIVKQPEKNFILNN